MRNMHYMHLTTTERLMTPLHAAQHQLLPVSNTHQHWLASEHVVCLSNAQVNTSQLYLLGHAAGYTTTLIQQVGVLPPHEMWTMCVHIATVDTILLLAIPSMAVWAPADNTPTRTLH